MGLTGNKEINSGNGLEEGKGTPKSWEKRGAAIEEKEFSSQ